MAPQVISDLIERFERGAQQYKSTGYKEAELRQEFINPFWEALGWDMTNRGGLAEAYKEVIHEDSLMIGGQVKAPDYVFRVGRERKFFLEAKAPKVDLKMDVGPAYQLKRYAWSAGLPVSILSDFEEFAVYQCTAVPKAKDPAAKDRIEYIRYTDYLDKWDFIHSTFSREAIWQGAFDKFAAAQKGKRGTTAFDKQFLADMLQWRILLAKNIALRNLHISERELNFAVQVTLDRIIMLRICEDRGIEQYGNLAVDAGLGNVLGGKKEKITGVYARLLNRFRSADDRFNSGLFHFSKEKNRQNSDELTPRLSIDDKILTELIGQLYYPESPYAFDYVPSDILGHVYEQFLGQVITLTAGHNARIEEKPEVKKAGGVYYTPTYIVDYIVKNTVGKLLDRVGRASLPDIPLDASGSNTRFKTFKDLETLTILDPACGSGSFLLGAYQYLLDWYLKYYLENEPKKWAKSKALTELPTKDREVMDYALSPQERKRILLTHIHGVDIDSQAVEVAKLNLMLKVLEGSNTGTSKSEFRTVYDANERLLPDLDKNILCGNSLIGWDYFSQKELPRPFQKGEGWGEGEPDPEIAKINPLDWKDAFPKIMKRGGFDAVIGNPPYVRQELIKEIKPYLEAHYRVYAKMADLYSYFIERSVGLLANEGIFSMIIANKWMRAKYGLPLRSWLATTSITEIVDFGDTPVFNQATTYPAIITVENRPMSATFRAVEVRALDFSSLTEYVDANSNAIEFGTLGVATWSLQRKDKTDLLSKLSTIGRPLAKSAYGQIYYGIKTGLNEAFVIDETQRDALIHADSRSASVIVPFLRGRDVARYSTLKKQLYLILFKKGWTRGQIASGENAWHWIEGNLPAIAEHLRPFQVEASARYDQGEYWWEMRQCDYYDLFEKPKIIFGTISQRAPFALDKQGFYSNDKTNFIPTDSPYLLGILNSRLSEFVLQSTASTKQGGYFEYKAMYVGQVPIKDLDSKTDREIGGRIEQSVLSLLEMKKRTDASQAPQERTLLERQIAATDREIDRLVYQLYGLTEEDIGIVEGV
jgi:type I restriction-modification system DNA methylase subunit